MSVDKTELCGSLLTWLQTFHVPPPCSSPQDLSSGLAIAFVLNQIDPSWFNEAWLQGISDDPDHNWRLKVANLKTILQSLVEYSQDVLGHPVSEQLRPDVSLIGKFSDPAELGKLLQLVLGCAIGCEKKQEHIQRIMTLGESVQQVVMEAIQELMTKDPPDSLSPETYGNFDSQSRRYYFLSEEAEEGDELRQRCLDLERQLVLLSEEKQSLAQENRALRERVGRPEGEGPTGLTAKKLLLLQSQLEQLQEENFRLESSREDERLRCAELEREVTELLQRNQELTSLAQEAQALKDEMDELRQSSERAGQLEATLSSCRRRLGELRELRRQVRQLEERNAGHAERTRQLEDELRRAGSLRAQLEAQRRQVQELQGQRQEEAMKAEKWLFECRNLEEKYESVTKEKERLLAERDSLREANEELRCAQLQPRGLIQADPTLDPTSPGVENLAAEILPAELRETLLRLQLENRRLCQQEAADRERQEDLRRHLEAANRARHGLETQQRLNQQQLSELRAQVEDLQKALQEQGGRTEDATLLKRKLEEHLSCARRMWSCSGSASTSRRWSRPPTAAQPGESRSFSTACRRRRRICVPWRSATAATWIRRARSYRPWNPSSGRLGGRPRNSTPCRPSSGTGTSASGTWRWTSRRVEIRGNRKKSYSSARGTTWAWLCSSEPGKTGPRPMPSLS
ncbi:protein Hook homolog 2 isoform X3 [Choloepus didactylus]|uniref:protein Hook homolog 2 isoform X3 n=1 Tax=Choloepus didactylus TaxID=27675 RepID=UPI00189D70B3|nr:protein Hook homolog 2 isoform X3 [Choloepus didactylus]